MEIRDDSGDHDNFTMIPNFVFRLGMSPYSVSLYGYIKQAAGETGRCFKSTATIAKELSMSAGTVSAAKAELEKNALIRINNIKRAQGGKAYHSIAILNVWQRNAEFINGHKKDRSPAEQSNSSDEIASSPSEIIKNPTIENPVLGENKSTVFSPADSIEMESRSISPTPQDSGSNVQAPNEEMTPLQAARVDTLTAIVARSISSEMREAVASVALDHDTRVQTQSDPTLGAGTFEAYEEELPFDDPPLLEEYDELRKKKKRVELHQSDTRTAKYLAAQEIGRWKHRWTGFKLKRDRDEWDKMDSLYKFETIKAKIDYLVSQGAAPATIAESVVKAVTRHCKEDKPREPVQNDNRLSPDIAIELPKPKFGGAR